MRRRDGRRAARPSRARCPPSLATSSSPLPSWSMEGTLTSSSGQPCLSSWASHLQQANIHFRADLVRVEYLSNADERLRWQANVLPGKDLCTENAIMNQCFYRCPLVIHPSSQAPEFILNEYKDRKITKTSFLDDAFRKNLGVPCHLATHC